MSSLADLPELVGFFSYSRDDDIGSHGALSALRERIQHELRAQLGRSFRGFRLWQDKEAIASGKLWEGEIKTAVEQSVFFIPIITPTVVKSPFCKFELDTFLAREEELGRTDLVFPMLYLSVPALEDEAQRRNDPVLSLIAKRQYVDWRELRHDDVNSVEVKKAVAKFCAHIADALRKPWLSPEERRQQEEAEAKRRAEDERRRVQEAETQRLADEEERVSRAQAKQRADEERALAVGAGRKSRSPEAPDTSVTVQNVLTPEANARHTGQSRRNLIFASLVLGAGAIAVFFIVSEKSPETTEPEPLRPAPEPTQPPLPPQPTPFRSDKGLPNVTLTVQLSELMGLAKNNFTFVLAITNAGTSSLTLQLSTEVPRNFSTVFTDRAGNQLTAILVESGQSKEVQLTVTPNKPPLGRYAITVVATADAGSATTNIFIDIVGP